MDADTDMPSAIGPRNHRWSSRERSERTDETKRRTSRRGRKHRGEWFRDARFARSSTTGSCSLLNHPGVRFPTPVGGNAALRDRPNRWSLEGKVVGPLAPPARARARSRLRCDSVGSPQLWRAVRHRHGDRGGLLPRVDVVAPADPSTGAQDQRRRLARTFASRSLVLRRLVRDRVHLAGNGRTLLRGAARQPHRPGDPRGLGRNKPAHPEGRGEGRCNARARRGSGLHPPSQGTAPQSEVTSFAVRVLPRPPRAKPCNLADAMVRPKCPGPLGDLRRSDHKRLEGVWSASAVVPIERKDRGGHPTGRRDLDEDRMWCRRRGLAR